MFRILHFFVVFVVILHNFDHVNGDKYQCSYDSEYPERCYLNELKLTHKNYEIVPEATNLTAVEKIVLHGTVPVLSTNEICKAMPNLITFNGDKISLEEILEEAFANCNKLERLHLASNNIFKIGRNSFKGLSNLKDLWISALLGNVPTLDMDLTDSKKLISLGLNSLKFVNFRAEILREQENLKWLYIISNNLFDLNIEEIIKNKPNLSSIYLNDNNFKCSRLTEILNLLKNKNIKAPATVYQKRVRSYTPNKIDGIMCLTDEQWEAEFIKLPLEQQLLHNQEMNIRKPKLTSLIIEKVEVLEKNQQGSVLSLETKLNDALKTMRNESMNLLEIRDEKFLNLQKQHTNLNESYNEEISNMKNNEVTIRKELEGLIENMDTIDGQILNLEANQTAQNKELEANLNKDLKSLETKMESKLGLLDGKISKVTETLETFTTKVDGQITEITKTLEKLNAKIEAQDALTLKIQEDMNKFMETLSNLLVTKTSTNNMMDRKMKGSSDEFKEAVKKV